MYVEETKTQLARHSFDCEKTPDLASCAEMDSPRAISCTLWHNNTRIKQGVESCDHVLLCTLHRVHNLHFLPFSDICLINMFCNPIMQVLLITSARTLVTYLHLSSVPTKTDNKNEGSPAPAHKFQEFAWRKTSKKPSLLWSQLLLDTHSSTH